MEINITYFRAEHYEKGIFHHQKTRARLLLLARGIRIGTRIRRQGFSSEAKNSIYQIHMLPASRTTRKDRATWLQATYYLSRGSLYGRYEVYQIPTTRELSVRMT